MLKALIAFMLMSVQIKSDQVVILNTLNKCIQVLI